MSMEDELGRAMSEASQRMEGFVPEISERIEELRFQQYGKAIGIGEINKPETHRILGYILPLSETEQRHLVMFKTGIIFTTKPLSSTYGEPRDYITYFSPSEQDTIFNVQHYSPTMVIDSYLNRRFGGSETEYRNDNPSHQSHIREAISQAMRLAHALKEKRESSKRESMLFLMKVIDGLLNPQEPNASK